MKNKKSHEYILPILNSEPKYLKELLNTILKETSNIEVKSVKSEMVFDHLECDVETDKGHINVIINNNLI